jgi:hypothetical protein
MRMWALKIVWKNVATGETVKEVEYNNFETRLDAEDFLLNAEMTETVIPVGHLTSPYNVHFELDPYSFYLKSDRWEALL